jgi:hypothetical protein
MGTIRQAQEEANMEINTQVRMRDRISGLESTRRLKDLVHASTAVRMLITITLISGTFVLLTFLTSLM